MPDMIVGVLAALGEEMLRFGLTYLLHSTLALGGIWLVLRWGSLPPAWEDTLWKVALFGSVLTAGVQVWLGDGGLGREVRLEAAWGREGERAEALARPSPPRPEPELSSRRSREAAADTRAVTGSREPGSSPRTHQPSATASAPNGEGAEDSVPWGAGPLVAWVLVAAGLLARKARRHRRFYAAVQGRRDVEYPPLRSYVDELSEQSGGAAPVRLTASDALPSPAVLGRREICVPEQFLTKLSARSQRSALAHEMGHLTRRDPQWNLAASLLATVFFFQPLNWVALRSLRETAEYLADDWAVRRGCPGLELAQCLSEVASWQTSPGTAGVAATAGIVEGNSALVDRTRRLLDGDAAASAPSATVRLAGAGVLVLALSVAAPRVAVSPETPSVDDDRPGRRQQTVAPANPGRSSNRTSRVKADHRDRTTAFDREFLEASNPKRVGWAARELIRHRPGRAVSVFLDVIMQRSERAARSAAIGGLRYFPDSLSLPVLDSLSRRDWDSGVGHKATERAQAKRAGGS